MPVAGQAVSHLVQGGHVPLHGPGQAVVDPLLPVAAVAPGLPGADQLQETIVHGLEPHVPALDLRVGADVLIGGLVVVEHCLAALVGEHVLATETEDEAGAGRHVENGIDVTGGAAAALGEDVSVGDLAQVQRVQDQEVSLVDLIHRSSDSVNRSGGAQSVSPAAGRH